MLPDFIIIGGMKCGTTALWKYLRDHPHLHVPELRKNLEFFTPEGAAAHTVEWYAACFDDAPPTAQAVGEISTEYTKHPFIPGVPARMAAVLPVARLVYLVRDPIERIVSHYLHQLNAAQETRPFHAAVSEEPDNRYLAYSRYHEQIEQFLPYYPAGRILVLTSEELRAEPAATLARLCQFLGVDSDHTPTAPVITHTRAEKRRWNALGRAIRRAPRAYDQYRYYRSRLPKPAQRLVDVVTGGRAISPVIAPETRAFLSERLAPDAARLRTFCGHDLSSWQV
jgi:hypothetical protein